MGKVKLDVAAAIAYGRDNSAGKAVGADRLGCASMTTGRFCATQACDPLGEGDATSSDMTSAGRCVAGRM
jgi:hypothetical protein